MLLVASVSYIRPRPLHRPEDRAALAVAPAVALAVFLCCIMGVLPSWAGPERAAPTRAYAFPVRSSGRISYGPYHHDYPATDIFCPVGSLFVAPTAGVVDYVSRVDNWKPGVDDPATRGGLSVAIIGDD